MGRTRKDAPLDDHLGDHELAVLALGKRPDVGAQLLDDVLALLLVGVLQGALDDTDTVVLEDKVTHAAGDDLEKLLDKSLALVGGDV